MIYPEYLGWDIFFKGYNAVQTEKNGPLRFLRGQCRVYENVNTVRSLRVPTVVGQIR